MQLVAYGAQDIYLTGNPQITFFKVVYRRHTNFSMECIEQTINGTSTLTSTTTSGDVTISRNGDLVSKVYITSSSTGITKGDNIIDKVDCEIGGQLIDRHYKEWNQIWAELSIPESKCHGYKNMIGATYVQESGTAGVNMIQVPLFFWFCRNPGLALPLIALQYHEVKLKITWGTSDTNTGCGTTANCQVFCDYIYLDTDERRRFAQVSHEYLIEQLQKDDFNAKTSLNLNFNHPVKELIWVDDQNTNYVNAKLVLNGHDRFSKQEEEYFQLRQPYEYHTSIPDYYMYHNHVRDLLPPKKLIAETEVNAVEAGTGSPSANGKFTVNANGTIKMRSATNPGTIYKGDKLLVSYPSSAGEQTVHFVKVTSITSQWTASNTDFVIVVSETGAALSEGTAGDGSITIIASHFNQHARCSNLQKIINVYSFALKPEEHQPSGTCNFSRIDNAQLIFNTATSGTVTVYAVNYNVLRIMSGMGGLAYSN